MSLGDQCFLRVLVGSPPQDRLLEAKGGGGKEVAQDLETWGGGGGRQGAAQ